MSIYTKIKHWTEKKERQEWMEKYRKGGVNEWRDLRNQQIMLLSQIG